MNWLFHILISLSLLYIGEISTVIISQILFLTTLIKIKKIAYLLYIPTVLFTLLKLFTSQAYLLYFLNLSFLIYYLYSYRLILKIKELFVLCIYLLFLCFTYIGFEDIIYELYLDFEIQDRVNYIAPEVVYLLSALHLFIFYILGYNREKLFRK